jgi:hypothetical protein
MIAMKTITATKKVDKVKIDVQYGIKDEIPNNMKNMHPYTITLKYQRRQMTTNFFTGSGWTKEPNQKDVLSALFADYSSFESSIDFHDFCSDMGYEQYIYNENTGRINENKEAKKTYNACAKNGQMLKNLLGQDFEDIQEEMQDY